MFYRKDAVLMAVAGLLATCGFAIADTAPKSNLSLGPVVTADDAAPAAPLMGLMEKTGVGKTMEDDGLNIYGWFESGYTFDHRNHSPTATSTGQPKIIPGPFNHEAGNHYMLNQLDIRIERLVDSKKFDVGGMIEILYGTDASITHSSGLNFGGTDPTTDATPADRVNDKWQATPGFDVLQAYVDVNVPVGNGLKIRTGKFVTLLGYETIDPRGNPFYSHSFLFSALPFTQTGVLGIYQFNDQFSMTAGVTRGWDQSLEDGGPSASACAVDGLGQFAWTPNKQWSVYVNWSVGPQNQGDTSHYRSVIDPIVTWQATDQLKLAAEALYLYDGGIQATAPATHGYGDTWGAAFYASYKLNEYFTLNGRLEKAHIYDANYAGYEALATTNPGINLTNARNAYDITIGVTITPLPKDQYFKNLAIRPEIRYDYYDGSAFKFYPSGASLFKDQLTFGADVIFTF